MKAAGPAVLIPGLAQPAGRNWAMSHIIKGRGRGPVAVLGIGTDLNLQQRRNKVIAGGAPVKPRMNHQNGHTRVDQGDYSNCDEPMGKTDPEPVTTCCR